MCSFPISVILYYYLTFSCNLRRIKPYSCLLRNLCFDSERIAKTFAIVWSNQNWLKTRGKPCSERPSATYTYHILPTPPKIVQKSFGRLSSFPEHFWIIFVFFRGHSNIDYDDPNKTVRKQCQSFKFMSEIVVAKSVSFETAASISFQSVLVPIPLTVWEQSLPKGQ